MESLFQDKVPLKTKIKPESIKFSELKGFALTDDTKTWVWPDQHAGDCTLKSPELTMYPGGYFEFTGSLSSRKSNDSWGILRFNFLQDNGLLLWSSGAFWSPTIGHWAPWRIVSQYPRYLFDSIALAGFDSHC